MCFGVGVRSNLVHLCAEADLQDAVLKLPESLPAMPTVLGQTDVRSIQAQARCGCSHGICGFPFRVAATTLLLCGRRTKSGRMVKNS